MKNVFWEVFLSENIFSAFHNCCKLCETLQKKSTKVRVIDVSITWVSNYRYSNYKR